MDRMIAAAIISNMKKRENEYSYLAFPSEMAPYRVAVLPLQKKDGLLEKAKEIFAKIQEIEPYSVFDESGAIGRRYARQDEIGTPFCITVDYDTLERDVVTIRERNSMKQIREVKVDTIVNYPVFLRNPVLDEFKSMKI
jgi:glycyl-tRNA synthetase